MTDIIITKKVGVSIQKKDGVWYVRTQNASFSFEDLASCVDFAIFCATDPKMRKDLSFP